MINLRILTTLIVILFVVSGCATMNTPPSQKAESSLDAVDEHLDELTNQLDETENSLDGISDADKSNLEEAYNTFTDDVSTIKDMRDELSDLVEEMRSDTDEYLTKWQNEAETYNNPQLRSGSEDRREELRQAFRKVRDNSGEVNRSMETFISDLDEIKSYLDNDLTIDGVEAVYSLSRETEKSGDEVKQAINSMQRSISDAKDEIGANTADD